MPTKTIAHTQGASIDDPPKFAPNGQPFVWLPVEALEKIRESCEHPGSGILVLIALYRIGCRERSSTFSKPLNYIATLSCVERRTVIRRLAELEKCGLVTIKRTQGELCEYCLPSLKTSVTKSPPSDTVSPGSDIISASACHPSYRKIYTKKTTSPKSAEQILRDSQS
jgi:hypothetical protein